MIDIYTLAFKQGMSIYPRTYEGYERRENYYKKLAKKPAIKKVYHYEGKLIDMFVQKYYPKTTKAKDVYMNVDNLIEGTILKKYRDYIVKSVIAKTNLEPSQREELKNILQKHYKELKKRL